MNGDGASKTAALALRARTPDAPFALGVTPRTWGDLLADAAAIARGLPQAGAPGAETIASGADGPRPADPIAGGHGNPARVPEIMVACTDRYYAAATLLGAWEAGWVAAHPPNGSQQTIDTLCGARGIALVVHDGGGAGGLDVRTLLGDGAVDPIRLGRPLASPAFQPERVLVTVYTSGSTGAHLACHKTAGQILGEARLLGELFALGPEARVLATVPPHHIYGLLFGVLVPLMGGGTVVRGTPHHAEAIAEQVATYAANVLVTVPAHLHGLGVLAPGAVQPVARVFSSGAPLPERTGQQAAALLGTAVTEVYGSSETGGIAWRQGALQPWRPFPGVDVAAGDDDTIVVRSPFAPRGSFRGADRVRVYGDGGFDLLGRADNVVKIGGSRTSTTEIQQRLLEVAGVRDAAVISVDVEGPRQHELWAALVAPGLSIAEVRAALGRWIDPIAMPRRFRLVDALPREENGKLVREKLRALFEEDENRETVEVRIPSDSPFFRGHFDDFPILPGVVQVNDLVLRQVRTRWPSLQRLRRVVGLKFKSPIRPGDMLAVELLRSEASKVQFQIRCGGGPVSSGTLVFELEAGS